FDLLHQARPFASPGRRRGGIVEQRTQREPRGLHLIVWNAGGYCAAFETVDLFTQPRAQPGRIGVAQRVPDLRHGGKDRIGGFDEGVQATERGEIGRGGLPLDRRGEGAAAFAARRWKNYGCIGVIDLLSAFAHATSPPPHFSRPRRRSPARRFVTYFLF